MAFEGNRVPALIENAGEAVKGMSQFGNMENLSSQEARELFRLCNQMTPLLSTAFAALVKGGHYPKDFILEETGFEVLEEE